MDHAQTSFAPPTAAAAHDWSGNVHAARASRTRRAEDTYDPDYEPLPLATEADDDASSETMGASDNRLDSSADSHGQDASDAINGSEQQQQQQQEQQQPASPLSAPLAMEPRPANSRSPAWPISHTHPTVWTMIRITNGPPSDPHAHIQGIDMTMVDHGPNVLYLAHTHNQWLQPTAGYNAYLWIKACHERYAYALRSTITEPVQIGQALLQQLWQSGLVIWSVAAVNHGPVSSIPDSLRLLSLFLEQRCYVDLNIDCDVLNGRGGHGRRYVGHQAFLNRRDELRILYQTSSDETKNQVVTQLIDWVHGRGGRFVESHVPTATTAAPKYYVMDNEKTVRKAKQALREDRKQQSSPQQRRQPTP
jgi:hypothetical protein